MRSRLFFFSLCVLAGMLGGILARLLGMSLTQNLVYGAFMVVVGYILGGVGEGASWRR